MVLESSQTHLVVAVQHSEGNQERKTEEKNRERETAMANGTSTNTAAGVMADDHI